MENVGLRWYKCDFHLHTMTSSCYQNKDNDTVNDWITEVKNKGLNCIAVTDHNDYREIDEIKKLGEENNIVVFPGVELSCDTSKIHILVLFDIDCDGNTVQEFLNQLKIFKSNLGDSGHTADGDIFHACETAQSMGALVIPAHIDEFSGLSDMSHDNICKLLDRKYINAVQVVNNDIWDNYAKEGIAMISKKLTEKYGKPISEEQAKKWRKVYEMAKNIDVPMLRFSDNPFSDESSKHGLWGIGKSYTWLKMSQTPNLESVRQALISYDMRVRKDVECSNIPDKQPDMIIRKIQISDCILNEKEDIKISFNPQMNTIIGGRGSGKSSIIRTIAGAMNSFSGENLNVISEEQKNFYKENGKSKSSGTRKGIFKRTSQVSVFIERLSDLYKIEVTDIKGMENQTRKLFKYIDGEWNVIEDEHFLDLFKAQIFTQKQIYELAMDSNSLMAIIDADIKELPQCLSEKDAALNNLVSKALEISNSKRIILDKPRLETELLDIESQISKYEKSGISDTLKEKQLFDDQEKALLSYIDRKKNKIDEIKKYLDEVVIAYDDVTDSEIKSLLEEDLNEFKLDINRLNQFCNEMLSKNDKLFEKVDNTEWKKKRIAIQNKYVSVMQNLQDNGLDTVKLDTLMEQRNNKKEEIDRILIKEKELCKLEAEYESLESVYRNKVDIIYKLRNDFIQEVIGNDKNVKFQLSKNRNRNSFINTLKAIMQKEITSVDDDINELADLYFKKEDGIEKYKKMLISIRNKEDQKSLSKKTRDIITSIAEDSFARMIAFIPDDDLIVSYRPEKAKKFIPLSNASAGQKTTTILTFLLAYGNQPLLLDQPEDDLDNRLVYDLIVARLKVAKSKRQIIVVTHNANIPVNGDSEYIISMDSETDIIQVNQTGTMDDESIRQEICDVMEGTKDAFEMRAKKYHFHIKE